MRPPLTFWLALQLLVHPQQAVTRSPDDSRRETCFLTGQELPSHSLNSVYITMVIAFRIRWCSNELELHSLSCPVSSPSGGRGKESSSILHAGLAEAQSRSSPGGSLWPTTILWGWVLKTVEVTSILSTQGLIFPANCSDLWIHP